MARPLSDDKRLAILTAATNAVAAQGIGAPTSKIAKDAGIAEGTLFTYFPSKDDLLNQLYLALKDDLGREMLTRFPAKASLADRSRHVWDRYIDWGAAHPQKRKAMRQLKVSDRVDGTSKSLGAKAFADAQAIFAESLASGALRDQSPEFVAAIMESLAETTMEFIAREPEQQEHYKRIGFEMFWNAVATH